MILIFLKKKSPINLDKYFGDLIQRNAHKAEQEIRQLKESLDKQQAEQTQTKKEKLIREVETSQAKFEKNLSQGTLYSAEIVKKIFHQALSSYSSEELEELRELVQMFGLPPGFADPVPQFNVLKEDVLRDFTPEALKEIAPYHALLKEAEEVVNIKTYRDPKLVSAIQAAVQLMEEKTYLGRTRTAAHFFPFNQIPDPLQFLHPPKH